MCVSYQVKVKRFLEYGKRIIKNTKKIYIFLKRLKGDISVAMLFFLINPKCREKKITTSTLLNVKSVFFHFFFGLVLIIEELFF